MYESMSAPTSIHNWLPCGTLGSGSSARVSLALSLPHGFLFALKSPLSSSSSAIKSLLNELHILLPLSSPFILRCLGADSSSAPHHLFLEFMEGGSLSHLLKRSGGRLQEPLVRLYTRSIVQGLDYLHRNGIVHCDIKGHNILIGSSGVKIADFGAAKRAEEQRLADQGPHQFEGTPLWMAPEVVQGVEQGFPSDIWSLGCTVVELIQGRPPLGHISDIAAALYKLACSDEAPPLPDSISDDARDFLLHCLQRDPKARWTASQLLQHPFLCKIAQAEDINEAPIKHVQLSPRSTLDLILQSEVSDSEDDGSVVDDVATYSHLPSSCSHPTAAHIKPISPSTNTLLKRQCTDAFNDISDECDQWITVKRATLSSISSTGKELKKNNINVPFMKSPKAGYVPVRRACDVSLEAAVFLKNRIKMVG